MEEKTTERSLDNRIYIRSSLDHPAVYSSSISLHKSDLGNILHMVNVDVNGKLLSIIRVNDFLHHSASFIVFQQ